MSTISYLRTGRKVRASGSILWRDKSGNVKVKPERPSWGAIVVSPAEIAAGQEKPEPRPRQKSEEPKPKRERKTKPEPVPRWKELVDRVRLYEADHYPDGWPAVTMGFLSEMADELEKAQTLFK